MTSVKYLQKSLNVEETVLNSYREQFKVNNISLNLFVSSKPNFEVGAKLSLKLPGMTGRRLFF